MYRQAEIEKWGEESGLCETDTFSEKFDRLIQSMNKLYRHFWLHPSKDIKSALGENYINLVQLACHERVDIGGARDKQNLRVNPSSLMNTYGLILHDRTDAWNYKLAIRMLDVFAMHSNLTLEECIDHAIEKLAAKDATAKLKAENKQLREDKQKLALVLKIARKDLACHAYNWGLLRGKDDNLAAALERDRVDNMHAKIDETLKLHGANP